MFSLAIASSRIILYQLIFLFKIISLGSCLMILGEIYWLQTLVNKLQVLVDVNNRSWQRTNYLYLSLFNLIPALSFFSLTIFLFRKKVKKDTQKIRLLKESFIEQLELCHDLRNSLTSAYLNLEMAQKTNLDNWLNHHLFKKRLQICLSNLKRIQLLLNQAKKQATLSNRMIIKSHPQRDLPYFSLEKIIQKNLALLTPQARQLDIELVFEKKLSVRKRPKSKKLELKGSSLKFGRIINNLIINAIESYPKTYPSSEIHKLRLSDKKQTLTKLAKPRFVIVKLQETRNNFLLRVIDFGQMIKPKNKKYLFQRAYSTKDPTTNSGLGLSIVKKIVTQDFNGQIKVKSQINKTTFTLIFPKD